MSNLGQTEQLYKAEIMKLTRLEPDKNVDLFVKSILIFEQDEKDKDTGLPFFADGYPGLIFHITPNGQWVQPQNKQMPVSYIYGQTLIPIELHMTGYYRIVAFQLYPFVLSRFFNIDARVLNDGCFDLLQLPGWESYEDKLLSAKSDADQVEIIQKFLLHYFMVTKEQFDFIIVEAINLIIASKAQITVRGLCDKLHVTVRTFERRFIKEVGIAARDFILITKFQQSLEQLTLKDFSKLSDIVYANGFSDQSHFIRVFKAFTGSTPKQFLTR